MANLNWRPWVEEALTARESESYRRVARHAKTGNGCRAWRTTKSGCSSMVRPPSMPYSMPSSMLAKSCWCNSFIIHDDELGQAHQRLLLRKAAEGCKFLFCTTGGQPRITRQL